MDYYLIIETYNRWLVDKGNGYRERVLPKKNAKTICEMNIGDRIIIYVASNISAFVAICAITQKAKVKPLSYEEMEIWSGPFSVRMYSKPIHALSEKSWVLCRPLVPLLSYLPNKKNWGSSMQGSLKKISEDDYKIIEKEILSRPNEIVD